MGTQAATPGRLYLMQVGSVPPTNVPFVCYLVQMSDGTNVLIDSGLAPIDPDTPMPPGRQRPVLGKNVVEQLAMLDLRPADIKLLVCTHYDGDHCGYHEAFTNAEYIVQRAHYEAALTSPRFAASRAHWDQPADRFRFVNGDTLLFPGLKLIETSGHTRGHQSVFVRLPKTGAVLLTIDAVPEQARFVNDVQTRPIDDDEGLLRASTQKLLDLVKQEQVSLVVFGHDAAQWKALKKLPNYYD